MFKLYPRRKLFIEWGDLLYAFAVCFRNGERSKVEREISGLWDSNREVVTALSVRTLLDATLQALAFEPGSEVLISAVTIADIPEIIRSHGLVPVAIEIDPITLAPRHAEAIEELITSRTKVILIAPLFGSLVPMQILQEIAVRNKLFVIEDLAQAYRSPNFHGQAESDLVLFSFGPIKTDTALGGGIALFKKHDLAGKVKSILDSHTPYSNAWFLRRVIKFSLLKALSNPNIFYIFAKICALLKINSEILLSSALRSFPGPQLLSSIRRKAPFPLLLLLLRRLKNFSEKALLARAELAAKVLAEVAPTYPQIGSKALEHTFWVFPFFSPFPSAFVSKLRQGGFDCSSKSSLIQLMDGTASPHAPPHPAQNWLASTVFLPLYVDLPRKERARLLQLLIEDGNGSKLPEAVGGAISIGAVFSADL